MLAKVASIRRHRSLLIIGLTALTALLGAGMVLAQGPVPKAPQPASVIGFTYQGQLKKNGQPVTDNACAMTFSLWDAASGGAQVGGNDAVSPVTVTNGLFTVLLNDVGQFGPSAFTGQARWIEAAVQCAGDGAAVVLTRQAIGASPYALYAANAAMAQSAAYAQSVNPLAVPGSKPYYPLLRPASLDLALVDGGLKGFRGGFTDGRYGYFVPNNNGALDGKVARVDLQNFTASGVITLDLALVDSGLKGFSGGFTDGRYGYFVPNNNGLIDGKVARVDLQNFTAGGVSILDLALVDNGLKGFTGGFTDGRYGYFVPDGNSMSGMVARVDLQNFTAGGVITLNLALIDNLSGFNGGFTDGRYGYFVPYWHAGSLSGKVVRIDLQYFTYGGVTTLDLEYLDVWMKGFKGGFTDGRYGYFVPSFGPTTKAARVDLSNFTLAGVTVLDLSAVDSGLTSFGGGFTDGRYGYFVPSGQSPSGKAARVDLQNFTTGGVTWIDFAATDAGLAGFGGGFSDGRFGYFAPYVNGSGYSGKVGRIPLFNGAGAP